MAVEYESRLNAVCFLQADGSLGLSRGIASAVKNGTGDFTLTLERPAQGVVQVTPFDQGAALQWRGQLGGNGTQVQIDSEDLSANPTDPENGFKITVYDLGIAGSPEAGSVT